MKLKLEDKPKHLRELELTDQEIYLFGQHGKDMILQITSNGFQFKIKTRKETFLFPSGQKEEAQDKYDTLHRINKEVNNNIEGIADYVKEMQPETFYQFEETFHGYKGITISAPGSRPEDGFHWTLYDKRGFFNKYPMRNKSYIKTFPTLEGCKRSLMAYIKTFFEQPI